MIANIKPFLGRGLYTVPEAALYARVQQQMMRRWLFGAGGKIPRRPVFKPEFASDEKLVSFLDFVQTLAIRAIRIQKQVPLQKIREAIQSAKRYWDMPFPFAMKHTTYLVGEDIVIVPPRTSEADTKEYVRVTGRHKGNYMLKQVVELYLENLDVEPRTGLARGYTVFSCANGVSITMNPHRRFGEPLLPSGYSAATIWDAVEIEGGIVQASRAYEVCREEVEAAMWFRDYLSRRRRRS